jgi:hypothetical protein
MSETDDLRPWDCQPGESSKAYQAFVIYRDLGADRSIQRVANELSKNRGTLTNWSHTWYWAERAAAWDSMPGRKLEEAYTEMASRIAHQHDKLATKLMERLEQHLELLPAGTDPSIKWSTAHGAARQGHSFATDLAKPAATSSKAITDAIENLLDKLAGEA